MVLEFRDYFRNYVILRISCVCLLFLSQLFHNFSSTYNFRLDPSVDWNGATASEKFIFAISNIIWDIPMYVKL
jgi:hypothetical protein